jgi:uncharacterized integral membrane protein
MARLPARLRPLTGYAGAVGLVAIVAALVALIVANAHQVQLDWIVGSTRASLVWVIVVAAVLGWLLGLRTSSVVLRRSRRDRSR